MWFLEGWLQMFGRANVLVLRTEDVFSKSKHTRIEALSKAIAHLSLDPPMDDVLHEMDAYAEHQGDYDVVQRSMHASGERGAAAMRSDVRAKLDAFFKPQKETLVAMFGDRTLLWEQPHDVVNEEGK